MPLRVIPFFLVFGLALLAAGEAWGQPTIFSVEAKPVYFFPRSGNVDADSTLGYGVGFTYGYRDRAVEFTIERMVTKLHSDSVNGTLVMLPLMANGYLRFHPYGRRWFPSIGVGFGALANNFHPGGTTPSDTVVSDSLAVQAILGFEVFLIPKLSVAAQGRYLYARADASSPGGKTVHIDLGGPLASFGVKKYF